MGMDVYGLNPKNAFGKIFRRNIWIWHPLWEYFEINYPEITSKVTYGHSNDGDGLDDNFSQLLAKIIENDFSNGNIVKYIEDQKSANLNDPYRQNFMAQYHDFRDFKDFLMNSGGFKIL